MFPREVRLKSKEEGEELLLGYEVSILQKEELEQKHYLMYFRDITKFERLRLERDRYLRMACMSRLLPTIAHEIKNPLAGIQSIAEVLMEELEQGTQRDDLALILNEAHRLKFIVDRMTLAERDLLNVATSTELHKVLHKAFKLTQARAWHLGVSMELKCEELEAYVEPNLLLMILLNLLYNSLEACQPNNRIVVALEQSTDKIEIRVSDNGEGMEASTLEQATNLFFSTKPTGLGIGLTLVKNILKRCGGEFDIWSQKGLGTRVTLSFARRMS